MSTYRPLIESYKSQIATLESKHSTARKESDRHESELNGAREKLARLEEERARERDGTALLEERIKELELGEKKGKVRDPDDSDDDGFGVGAELDDALSGTTTTSLKLRIRKLERQLEAAATNGGDASQVAVLEHLLEDSRKMKDKYEGDYLKETRERIKVERKLEEILSGKSRSADRCVPLLLFHGPGVDKLVPRNSPEVAIALRQRLNETVEELETVRKQLAEIEVNFESQQRELTIAKSNRTFAVGFPYLSAPLTMSGSTIRSESRQQGSA